MTPCYIFDLDGTLADCRHRLHFIERDPADWDAFFAACVDDAPIKHMIGLAEQLFLSWRGDEDRLPQVVVVSGRSSAVRLETHDWLELHGPCHHALYMRRAGDHRPDDIVKRELLAQIRADGYGPIMAFDDRDRVVAMWREEGIPCAQVAPGDF